EVHVVGLHGGLDQQLGDGVRAADGDLGVGQVLRGAHAGVGGGHDDRGVRGGGGAVGDDLQVGHSAGLRLEERHVAAVGDVVVTADGAVERCGPVRRCGDFDFETFVSEVPVAHRQVQWGQVVDRQHAH